MEIVRNLTSSFLEDFNKTPKSRSSGREKAAEILRHSKKALLKSPDKRKMLMDFSNMAIWSREYADEFNSLFSEMERAIKAGSASDGGADCSEIVKIASAITIGVSMFHLITATGRFSAFSTRSPKLLKKFRRMKDKSKTFLMAAFSISAITLASAPFPCSPSGTRAGFIRKAARSKYSKPSCWRARFYITWPPYSEKAAGMSA